MTIFWCSTSVRLQQTECAGEGTITATCIVVIWCSHWDSSSKHLSMRTLLRGFHLLVAISVLRTFHCKAPSQSPSFLCECYFLGPGHLFYFCRVLWWWSGTRMYVPSQATQAIATVATLVRKGQVCDCACTSLCTAVSTSHSYISLALSHSAEACWHDQCVSSSFFMPTITIVNLTFTSFSFFTALQSC